MANRYTDEDRQRIREHLIEKGGNQSAAARDLGVPRTTVRAIAQGRATLVATIDADDAVLWQTASHAVARRIADIAPTSDDLGQLAAAARAASSAHLDYRDGRKGTNMLHVGDTHVLIAADTLIAAALAARASQ